jgi:hypothetical protein
MASWLIRLESVSGEGASRLANFTFAHERELGAQASIEPAPGDVVAAEVNGIAAINAYGFPVELKYTLQRQYYGYGEEMVTLRYAYEDQEYLKEVWFEGSKADYSVPVPEFDGIDKSLPAGVFLFTPDRGRCDPWQMDSTLSQLDPRGPRVPTMRNDCGASDLAFANPGFLDIAMPALWEAGGTGAILCLMPTGPEFLPGGRSSLGFSSPQGSLSGGLAGPPEWSMARDLQRHYRDLDMVVGERVRISVGRRKMDATLVELSNPTALAAYVDNESEVVRLDLNPQLFGASGASSRMLFNGPELWIRKLFPSEF